jgi:hypothetical protein
MVVKKIEHGSGVYSFEINDEDVKSYEGLTVEKLRQEGASDDLIDTIEPYMNNRD